MSSSSQLTGVPSELIDRDQWVTWRSVLRGDKPTKVPFASRTNKPASVTDPTTWAPFQELMQGNPQVGETGGVGFVFTADDPFAGIDLDGCRDPFTGEIEDWAWEIIWDLSSYSEVSPSGTGVKIFVRASLPEGAWSKKTLKDVPNTTGKSPAVETFASGRFFTVTGLALPDTFPDTQPRQSELMALQARFADKPQPAPIRRTVQTSGLSPEAVIQKAMNARNGAVFARLWGGDTSGHGNDHSSADLALCHKLAFWTGGDHAMMDSLFRQSGLMRPKWDKRSGSRTYGARTIDKAISGAGEFYGQGRRATSNPVGGRA